MTLVDDQMGIRHIVVPDLHDTAGIFSTEARRESLVATYGPPIPETAPETADRLAEASVLAVCIHGASNDTRACRILSAQIRANGVEVSTAIHPESDEGPAHREPWDAFAQRCRRAVHMPPSGKAALPTPPCTGPEKDWGLRSSPIPQGLGLTDPAKAERMLDLIRELWPHRVAAWISLLQDHALAINPIENVYAGQHLRDRNADLLVNIL